MDNLIRIAEDAMWTKKEIPSFKSGDTITVSYKIVEGNKERIQSFRGVVIQIKGRGVTKMFTIRKVSNGIGVERIFPLYSPHIESIEVNKVGVVRRARIYYLRDLTGKKRVSKRNATLAKKRLNRQLHLIIAREAYGLYASLAVLISPRHALGSSPAHPAPAGRTVYCSTTPNLMAESFIIASTPTTNRPTELTVFYFLKKQLLSGHFHLYL